MGRQRRSASIASTESAASEDSKESVKSKGSLLAKDAAAAEYHPTKKRYLFSAAVLWVGMVVLAKSLQSAGVTKNVTDIRFEEFLARTGWIGYSAESYESQEKLRPGFLLSQQGARAKFPVVMVPGFVTSGLEVWAGKPCVQSKFRKRLWGGLGTARGLLAEQTCWFEHMALDPFTGMDPEGIRLRAAQGFEAADYFMANYWVWGKLIENLADLGYDGSSMVMESYDWRLAFGLIQKRDGYFTRLRHSIEAMHETSGRKVVIAAHSMGSQVLMYFFAWVTTDKKDGGGGGGPGWVDEHVHAFVNIAGPMLGVPKAACALLSGEMRDTSHFIGVLGSMIETFLPKRVRKDLWMSWGSLWAMLPKGGDRLWGVGADVCNASSTPHGLRCIQSNNCTSQENTTPILEVTDTKDSNGGEEGTCEWNQSDGGEKQQELSEYLNKLIDDSSPPGSISVDQLLEFLHSWGGGHGPSTANAKEHSIDERDPPSPKTWSDPSRTPLPYAPDLSIYCLYGVGLSTERAYFYRHNAAIGGNSDDTPTICNETLFEPPLVMNTSVDDPEQDIVHGVKFADGDGSVPLLSLGYLCADGWKTKELNPSGTRIITREYPDAKEFQVDDPVRGGPHAADHVDILGNVDMTDDFLRIVSGFGVEEIQTHIVSDIENIAKRINAHDKATTAHEVPV